MRVRIKSRIVFIGEPENRGIGQMNVPDISDRWTEVEVPVKDLSAWKVKRGCKDVLGH